VGTGCPAQPSTPPCGSLYLRDRVTRVTATHRSDNIYAQAAECFLTEQIFVRYTPTVPLTTHSVIRRRINM